MTKKIAAILLTLVMLVSVQFPLLATISIPNIFTPFSTISSTAVNQNFSTLGTNALNRTGDTITGNIAVSNGVTIDGADISAYLAGGKLTASDTSSTSLHIGGGMQAGTGNVSIIGTDGRIPAVSSTYFANLSGVTPFTTIATSALMTSFGGDAVIANGTFTITLSAAASNTNKLIDIKNVGTGVVTVAGNGAELIDAANTFVIASQYQSITIISDGTQWWIL